MQTANNKQVNKMKNFVCFGWATRHMGSWFPNQV